MPVVVHGDLLICVLSNFHRSPSRGLFWYTHVCQNNALEKTRGYKKGDSITVTLSLFPAPPRVCSRRAASLLNTLSGATTRAGDAPHRRPRDDQAAAECVWADDGLLLTQICGLPLATSYDAVGVDRGIPRPPLQS